MDASVLAIGLLVAFVGVVWAAVMLWGMICPSVPFVPEKRWQGRRPNPPPAPPTTAPVVHRYGDAQCPVVIMPDAPAIAAVAVPNDEKVVILSEWRDRREGTG